MKGLLKAEPVKEEPQPYIDCTGNLQVMFLKLSTIGSSFLRQVSAVAYFQTFLWGI